MVTYATPVTLRVLKNRHSGERNHFHSDYRKPGEHWRQPNLEYQEKSFLSARNYFETHGGRIFNATRGGCLECFPRIDLDTLLFS